MIPPDIMAMEIKRAYDKSRDIGRRLTTEERNEERLKSINEWQSRWDMTEKGRWTYKLIGNVKTWVERKHGETDFYLTQFLTGHGCFREYLFKYGHDDGTDCSFCGDGRESVQHIFFTCPKYEVERAEIETLIKERVTKENIVHHMIQCKIVWNKVKTWSAIALQELRRNEMQRSSEKRRASEE